MSGAARAAQALVLIAASVLSAEAQEVARSGTPQPVRLVERADSAWAARDASAALQALEAALQSDSAHYPALWRASRAAVSLGMMSGDEERQAFYYQEAERWARRAVRVDSLGARGVEWLAVALGRVALTHGSRTRARYAEEIYATAHRALALDPESDAAHHVLGAWHAEIRRLSGFSRFMARNLLGAQVFENANWEDAVRLLERAVELAPQDLVHRVDLARIYLDQDRPEDARAQLETALSLPDREPTDPLQREEARRLLETLDAS